MTPWPQNIRAVLAYLAGRRAAGAARAGGVGKQPDAGYHVRQHEGVGTAPKEGRQGGGDVPARHGPIHEAAGPSPPSKVQLGKRERFTVHHHVYKHR